MVYLYSIISGFRAVLGSPVIQMCMAISCMLYVSVPTSVFTQDYYDSVGAKNVTDLELLQAQSDSIVSQLDQLKFKITGTHLFCAIAIFIPQYFEKQYFHYACVIMICAMMMQVSNITTICDFFVNTGAETAPPQGLVFVYTPEYDQYFKWLQLEICVFTACLFANMTFLAIRSCFTQKMTLT